MYDYLQKSFMVYKLLYFLLPHGPLALSLSDLEARTAPPTSVSALLLYFSILLATSSSRLIFIINF